MTIKVELHNIDETIKQGLETLFYKNYMKDQEPEDFEYEVETTVDLDLEETEDLADEEVFEEVFEVVVPTETKAPKKAYITNKEFLAEIHKSKNSYCVFRDLKYSDYDSIVQKLEDITDEVIQKTKADKARRMVTQEKAKMKEAGRKPAEIRDFDIKPEDINTTDLVFRVMSPHHLPLDPFRKRRSKNEAGNYVKTPFHPFKHYVILETGEFYEVGRSHWKGTIEDGHFDMDRGQISHRLATMFMLLVDRYSRRPNWRSYCVDTETEALTQRGWLKYDEINESDIIMSYTDGKLKWSKINDIYRGQYEGKMHNMTMRGMDSFVTPGHKFVTDRGLVKAEFLKASDKLILLGNELADDVIPVYDDALVELIGWILTEGTYEWRHDGKLKSMHLCQNEGPKAERIRNVMRDLNITWSEKESITMANNTNVSFTIFKSEIRDKIFSIIPDKNLNMELILKLSNKQKELLVDTMIDGDGWRSGSNRQHRRYTQKDKNHIDLFQALLIMTGHRSVIKYREHISFGKETCFHYLNVYSKRLNVAKVETVDFHGGFVSNTGFYGKTKENYPNIPTTDYSGIVWCPKTEYGCFVARRNGNVYLTGNTYLDEMKGHALLQLSQVGLQFDESKSDNPFAFYTSCVKRRIKIFETISWL